MQTMSIKRIIAGTKNPPTCAHGNKLDHMKNVADGSGYALCSGNCECEVDMFAHVAETEHRRYGEMSDAAANRIAELEEWARCAYEALQQGAKLMPQDQLREWSHVGATLADFPLATDENGEVVWP